MSVLLAGALFAAALAMDVWTLEPVGYRVGGYVPRGVYARVPFKVVSEEKTEDKRRAAAEASPAVIVLNEPALSRIVSDLKSLTGALKATTQRTDLPEAVQRLFAIRPEEYAAIQPYLARATGADEYAQAVDRLRESLLTQYLLDKDDFEHAYHRKGSEKGLVQIGEDTPPVSKGRLLDLGDPRKRSGFLAEATATFPAPVRKPVAYYLSRSLTPAAGIFQLDLQATRAAEESARESVGPQFRAVPAGTLLARRTDRGGLSRSDFRRLEAEHSAFAAYQNTRRPWRVIWLMLGRAGMIAGIVALLGLYVGKYRPRVVKSHWRGLAIVVLLALTLLLGKVMAGASGCPLLAVFGVFLASVILTIAYDQRFAFAVCGALVLLTALQLRLDTGSLLVLWAAAAAAVFQLREVRTRTKLIEAGVITGAVVFVGIWLISAAKDVPLAFALKDGGFAALAAVASGFVALGILPVVERVFHIATSLTLLEWCDTDKPLLKRLALEARGTHSHAVLLGSMCEAAAEAIGARGLLARVGAYYHDVGKVNKPEYFAENQSGPGSKHDRLSPAMSLLVIRGHVKDGLELARQFSLPHILHEFIASHHGTTLVEYFYHAATQQRKQDVERAPEEIEFRYPGPKPRSREAAILMLADASESAVRAMPEPTPGRIETQVHQVISKRLTDGQLDDCELRLQEVHAIEASLVRSISSAYHGRIMYPTQKNSGESAEPRPNGAPARPNAKTAG